MCRAHAYVDGFSRGHIYFFVVKRDLCSSLDHDPMLGALGMFLITQTLAGQNFDSLHLKPIAFIKHGECTPGTAIEFWRVVDSLITHPCYPLLKKFRVNYFSVSFEILHCAFMFLGGGARVKGAEI